MWRPINRKILFSLINLIIGNENNVQKRERATNHADKSLLSIDYG